MAVFKRHLLDTFTFQIVCMIEKLSVFNQMLQIQFLLFFFLLFFLISSRFLFFSFYFLSELKLLKYSNFLKANLHLLEDVNGFKNKKNPISFGWLVVLLSFEVADFLSIWFGTIQMDHSYRRITSITIEKCTWDENERHSNSAYKLCCRFVSKINYTMLRKVNNNFLFYVYPFAEMSDEWLIWNDAKLVSLSFNVISNELWIYMKHYR